MKYVIIIAAASAMMIGAGAAAVAPASQTPDVPGIMNPSIGGQAMLASRSIVENMASSPEHTQFVSALRTAGLEGTLKGKGPYTVFAPTDDAFSQSGLKSASPAATARAMDYLVIKGRYDSQALLKLINEHGGQARLTTLEGGTIVASMNGPTNIVLVDEKGNSVPISTYDVYDANGVTHVIDRVIQAD